MANINIKLPDKLHEDLRLAKVYSGRTIKKIIVDILTPEVRKKVVFLESNRNKKK